MNKSVIFLFFLLVIPMLSAAEVDMKSNFSSEETLLAKVSGNFLDQIADDNVFFYRGHVQIPMTYDVLKIEDDYYIYGVLTGKPEGNYSLSVEGVRYMKGTQISDENIVSNFTVSNKTAIFSVNPGVVFTSVDFSIEFQNIQDKKITIDVDKESASIISTSSFELQSGEKKSFVLALSDDAERGLVNIEFSSEGYTYTLPVYIDTDSVSNGTIKKFEMEFHPSNVEVQMATNSDTKRILYLKNTGKETIDDITLEIPGILADYVEIFPRRITRLEPNSTEKIEIEIDSGKEEMVVEGKIKASTEGFSESFTLVLDFIDDFKPADGEDDDIIVLTTCEELEGTFCSDTQECSEDTVEARDGVCCITPGQCLEKQKSSSGRLIGWVLILLAFALVFWFYKKKYMKVPGRRPF